MLDSYLSAIDGEIHDTETRIETFTNHKSGDLGANIGGFSGRGQIGKGVNEEIKKDVQISPSAKFNKLFEYLEKNKHVGYYEFIKDNIFNDLSRDDFIEVLVRPRFSKIKEVADAAKNLSNMANVLQQFTNAPIIDKNTKNAFDDFSRISEIKSSKTVSCVFNFEDGAFPIIAYLN